MSNNDVFLHSNGVFFAVKNVYAGVRKSNILAPKHGADCVILASITDMNKPRSRIQ